MQSKNWRPCNHDPRPISLFNPRRQEIDPTNVPYSNEALSCRFATAQVLCGKNVQSMRDRKAIYLYLGPVFDLVEVWEALGQLREIIVPCFTIAGRKYEDGARSSSGRDFLHVGSGKSRSQDPQQMVTCSAVCRPCTNRLQSHWRCSSRNPTGATS